MEGDGRVTSITPNRSFFSQVNLKEPQDVLLAILSLPGFLAPRAVRE
jgi:hypothetical protein